MRRTKGSGSVVERQPGVWRVRVYLGQDPVTHRPLQVERTVHGTRRNAEEVRRQIETETASGMHRRTTRGTVAGLLEAWLSYLEKVKGARPSTLESRRIIVRRHLTPALGDIPLNKLTAFDLDSYYKEKLASGLGAGTVRFHHQIMAAALQQGVLWDWVARSPAVRANPPPPPKRTRRAPSPEDIRAMIGACGDDVDVATAVAVGAVTGARRGELCGLRWTDVDWEHRTLRIERQRITIDGADRTGPTKSDARTVTLGDGGVAILNRYRQLLMVRAELLGVDVVEDGWLLSYDCGRTPMRPKNLSAAIREAGRRAGVNVTSHLLRYFAATQMVGAGVDPRTAAARLGHTTQMLLNVYADFLPHLDQEAARILESLVIGNGPAVHWQPKGDWTAELAIRQEESPGP